MSNAFFEQEMTRKSFLVFLLSVVPALFLGKLLLKKAVSKPLAQKAPGNSYGNGLYGGAKPS